MSQVAELTKQIERLLEEIERTTEQTPVSDARRASFRYVWPGHATVEFVDPDNWFEPLLVTVGHISRDGLDFRSPRRFQVDQKLLITLDTDEGQLQIPATVIHSTQSVVKFATGVMFDLEDSPQAEHGKET